MFSTTSGSRSQDTHLQVASVWCGNWWRFSESRHETSSRWQGPRWALWAGNLVPVLLAKSQRLWWGALHGMSTRTSSTSVWRDLADPKKKIQWRNLSRHATKKWEVLCPGGPWSVNQNISQALTPVSVWMTHSRGCHRMGTLPEHMSGHWVTWFRRPSMRTKRGRESHVSKRPKKHVRSDQRPLSLRDRR